MKRPVCDPTRLKGLPALAIRFLTLSFALAWGEVVRAEQPKQPLILERSIALPNTAGRIDHMAVDLVRMRLIVAELGNNTVDVVDIRAGVVAHRISGLSRPQ